MSDQMNMPVIHPNSPVARSQWFTQPELGRRIVNWTAPSSGMRVLEPSAGNGAFVTPLLEHRGVIVEALEIDPRLAHKLVDDHKSANDLTVHNANFLEWRPDIRFDLCILNPPYRDDQDADHLVHALSMSNRVVCLLRTNIVHGVGRYNRFWKHVTIQRKINFINRPRFHGVASPQHDFCVIDMAMGSSPKIEVSLVATEWWWANQ